MLARFVHHTDDLQRPDAPLIALVTESADGRSSWRGTQLPKPPSYDASWLQVPSRSCAQRRRLCTSAKGVGAAFALEKAVLLRLPPVCPAGFKKVTGSAVSCPESCLKIGIPA